MARRGRAENIIAAVGFEEQKYREKSSSHKSAPVDATTQSSQIPRPANERPPGRTLGLDVGSRRIGIAVSDPLGITAQGLETLQRRNKRQDLAALDHIIRDYAVKQIVIGLPLRMSGAEGTQSDRMLLFAEALRKRFRLPVHLWDERLTSAEANRLLRESELSIEKRAKAVDRMAAVLILQGWMDGNPPSPSATSPPSHGDCRGDRGLRGEALRAGSKDR